MDAETINQSTDVEALQERHKQLLQTVENFRNGKNTDMTEVQAVAEKIAIKARLRTLGAPVKREARQSTVESKRAAQTVSIGGKGAN